MTVNTKPSALQNARSLDAFWMPFTANRQFKQAPRLLASASGRGGMLLRVQPEVASALVAEGSASFFMMRGRELPGWLHVELDPADERLTAFLDLGLAFVATLESKAVNRLGPDRSRM